MYIVDRALNSDKIAFFLKKNKDGYLLFQIKIDGKYKNF